MSTQAINKDVTPIRNAATTDMKLEVVVIPVSDVDRSKQFYESLGWRLDADFAAGDEWRLLQQVTARLPGRGLSSDVPTLIDLLQETEKRHGSYEPTAPKHHWSAWYAAYMIARERGKDPDAAAAEAALNVERTLATT
jgi:catechol 2,3-dioxygenase-like lactoylglutathione lyase family enzyme